MTKIYKDVATGTLYSTEEIGMKLYRYVDHTALPTLTAFIESVSVENGGTLKEMSAEELVLSDEEFNAYRAWTNKGYFETLGKKSPVDIKHRTFTEAQRETLRADGYQVVINFINDHKNEKPFCR